MEGTDNQGGIRGSFGVHLHAGERFGRGESPPGGANILLDIRPGANDLRPHRGGVAKQNALLSAETEKQKLSKKKNRSAR